MIIYIYIYLKKKTVRMHILYILNTHIKFIANQILFTIRLINLFFMLNFRLQNLKFKYLIDNH